MGIKIEFNPELALRSILEFKKGNRRAEECIPENLAAGNVYSFLKKDQRNYWLFGEIPLVETRGSEDLSRPKASVVILETTHYIENGEFLQRACIEYRKFLLITKSISRVLIRWVQENRNYAFNNMPNLVNSTHTEKIAS